jgi:putative restriction endonuclease
MQEFDRPLFKRLAPNDTKATGGHQGGIVIPKDMDRYFPQLVSATGPQNPTADERISAALFVGTDKVGLVDTRYQYQTWGGTRSPERRLTGNLGPILSEAKGGDFLLIERSLSDPAFYRLTLHKGGTPAFDALLRRVGDRRWGSVEPRDAPVSEVEIAASLSDQETRELNPFNLFENAAALQETRATRIARSRAFNLRLLPLYNFTCAVCGRAHRTLDGVTEAEAAHIVPRSLKGADDSRNGIALCRSHHWTFDRGLFGIRSDRTIVVPPKVIALAENSHLAAFNGERVLDPNNVGLRPDASALAWHLRNLVRL